MGGADVIVYTTDTCPYCTMMVDFLTRQNIPFEERNMTKEPRFVQQLVDLGAAGVPTAVVKGQTVVGYQPQRVLEITGRD